jgi:hypothetical protein
MTLSAICKNCNAPLDARCSCAFCSACLGGNPTYCHVCRALYSVVYTSSYFTAKHHEWEREQIALRNRAGL